MTEMNLVGLGLAALVGIVLGSFYFAGLWLTVRRLPGNPSPYRLYSLSLLLRLCLLLAGFSLLATRGHKMLLVGGLGFMAARQAWLLNQRRGALALVRNKKREA